jgi:pimeloyl-ACP methyl ester carboxylesterase
VSGDGQRRGGEAPPATLETLTARFDPSTIDLPRRGARIRLGVTGRGEWDALVSDAGARLERAGDRPGADAVVTADAATWSSVARDLRGGMGAFRAGRLSIRHNLNLGVGFLAATSGATEPERLEVRHVRTRAGAISTFQAGSGTPVLALHGLGGTKASFLPTIEALAPHHRVIAMDLPGFGDSVKPLGAPYDAAFFARSAIALLDALGIARADLVGNSMGGRVAIELGLRAPERTARIALLSPSLAWLRDRRWASFLRLVRPELGLVQAAPRAVVERVARRLVAGAGDGWVEAGVDEFLRAYLQPRGRAAFYAAARSIYLEEPRGARGFWTRLAGLSPDALFVWGRQDRLVPIAFARHVERTLPAARHLELDCGHVPQLERPRETHAAILDFLAQGDRNRVAAVSAGASGR